MNPLQAAVWTLLIYVSLASPLATADTPATSEAADQRCGGEPCAAVIRGLFAFFDRDLHGLDGNGRSCNDCHMVTEQFRLTPAAAESRYQLLQKRRRYNPHADDPLFRPLDADDFRINGEHAERLRQSAAEWPDPASSSRCRRTFGLIDPSPTNPRMNQRSMSGAWCRA
jgi:hypothetical protein